MKKYIGGVVLVAIIILSVPSIAEASWWNPFSWFKKDIPTTVQVEPVVPPVHVKTTFPDTKANTSLTETISSTAFTAEMSAAITSALKTYSDKATLQSFTTVITSDTMTLTASLKGNILIGNPKATAVLAVTDKNHFRLVSPVTLDTNVLVRNYAAGKESLLPTKLLWVLQNNRPGKTISTIQLTDNALIVTYASAKKVPSTPPTSATGILAQCLKDKGVKLYSAFWCPHCIAQKAMFGEAANKLPYVECSTDDKTGQTALCTQQHITGYPTWRFQDGSELQGEQSLATLTQKAGCK